MSTGPSNKRKGGAFEREVCKSLSLWITNGKKDDVFWRSAMSGGRSTIGKSGDRKLQAGDVSATGEEGEKLTSQFYIECKNYLNLNFTQLITKKKGFIVDIFLENNIDAKKYNKKLLLIMKQRGYPSIVVAKKGTLKTISDYNNAPVIIPLDNITIEILSFDDFLKGKPMT